MKVSWGEKPLADVCEKITQGPNPKYDNNGVPEFRVLKTKHLYDDGIKYSDADHLSEEVFSNHLRAELQDGDVLLAIVGQGSINKCNVFEQQKDARFVFTRALGLLRPERTSIDPFYLKYFLQSDFGKGMVDAGIGGTSGQQVVTTTHLKKLVVPVPPLEEQKRIVAVLDAAFDGLNRARANAEANFNSARELFETEVESSFAGSAQSKTSLSDLISISHGFSFKSSDFEASTDINLPVVLTPGNFSEDAQLVLNSKKTKRLIGEVPEQYLFEKGELTVVMTDLSSQMKILGKPAFIETDNVLHNQRIGRVTFENPRCLPRYLYYFLRTRFAANQIRSTATGTMVRHTAPKRILALPIYLPSNAEEQKCVIDRLDNLSSSTESLKSAYSAKIQVVDELRQSLLVKAFAGELT